MSHINTIIKLLDTIDILNFGIYGSKRQFMSVTMYGDKSGHFSYGNDKIEGSFANPREAVDVLAEIYEEVKERYKAEGLW